MCKLFFVLQYVEIGNISDFPNLNDGQKFVSNFRFYNYQQNYYQDFLSRQTTRLIYLIIFK